MWVLVSFKDKNAHAIQAIFLAKNKFDNFI